MPYISHLLDVSALVWADGGTESEAIAGLLHDAVEDGKALERYANEELIAELGSVFVTAILGMDYEQRDDDNHAAYLAHWLKALKADPSLLWKAATKASAAAEYLAYKAAKALAEKRLRCSRFGVGSKGMGVWVEPRTGSWRC